jgi:hypothetical protein
MGKAVSDGVIRGIVTNIDKTVRAIEMAIEEASAQSEIEINVVNVGIAGQHIKSSIHHGSITRNNNDEISIEDVNRLANDMHRIVIPPGSEIIHVMPQDYIVDYEKERLIGDSAKNQVSINPTNTIFDAKRMIGRTMNELKQDMKHWPFKVVDGKSNQPNVQVTYKGEEKIFSPEEISSMVLIKMKEIAESYLGK